MVSSELLKKFGFTEEIVEVPYVSHIDAKGSAYAKTGFPKPERRYKLIWEAHELSIEEPYYWMYTYFQEDLGFPEIIKTEDVFAAAENSAFFGISQQRLGAQQDKTSQFLATVGKMIKELFQLVRELRILDERMIYYDDALMQLQIPFGKRKKASEITLKGIFIDLVQGGAKNPASVYGMSRELEFTTLPDLFFDVPPMNHEEVDDYVNKLDFNRKVLEVLKRHLKQFIIWKERTYSEVQSRRRFTLQYLKQHYEIIKMYITWIKPYLRYSQRLAMKKGAEKEPEMVTSFETSMIDVEFLGKRSWGKYNTVVLTTFNFRTRPSMKYVQEGYNRGPIHVGRVSITLRGYVWTDEDIKRYIEMKDSEDFELLKAVSSSVQAAMEALGDELKKYLEEAGKAWEHEKIENPKTKPEPIAQKLFGDFLGPKVTKPNKPKKFDKVKLDKEKSHAKKDLSDRIWLSYRNFKKGHGLIHW